MSNKLTHHHLIGAGGNPVYRVVAAHYCVRAAIDTFPEGREKCRAQIVLCHLRVETEPVKQIRSDFKIITCITIVVEAKPVSIVKVLKYMLIVFAC